ncbi:MAG: L-histidine N(alpha)-methyltransferase, partial [Methanomassiliicoccales archaeon]
LGIRHARKRGTVMIIEKGQKIPFDISNYGLIYYYDSIHEKTKFDKDLSEFFKRIESKKPEDNPVIGYFEEIEKNEGTTKLSNYIFTPKPFSFVVKDYPRLIENVLSMDAVLFLICENEFDKQVDLIDYLKGQYDGEKKIVSGFSYWGKEPTHQWGQACNSGYYIMRRSIENFPKIWNPIYNSFPGGLFHYVSLGVGTGKKDIFILKELCQNNKDLIYIPIDMSIDMLRKGVNTVKKDFGMKDIKKYSGTQIAPIQADFSGGTKLEEIREVITDIVNKEPIIFGLLGNTLSNFDDDSTTLKNISKDFLRSSDLLLLEIARTGQITEKIREKAIVEYSHKDFKKFAISALSQVTDIDIDIENVEIQVKEETMKKDGNTITRALKILTYYTIDYEKKTHLPNDEYFKFKKGDKIRIYLSRKYTKEGINSLIKNAGLKIIDEAQSKPSYKDVDIGLQLLLLKKEKKEEKKESIRS